jgi:RimJ/RimL family protein N-acetyltransferase
MAINAELQLQQPALLEAGGSIVMTKTGRTVVARLLGRADAPLLVDLFARLSERTRWLRFSKPRGSEELAWREATRLAGCDAPGDTTLVGVVYEEGEERAVALVQMVRVDATVAEVAAVVRDDYQNDGVGKAICRLAAQVAAARGIKTLQILTLAENRVVQWLVRSIGAAYTAELQHGELTMTVQLPG